MPEHRLSDDELAKIVPGWTYAACDEMLYWKDVSVDMEKARKYVLNFVGTVTYGREEIARHRKEALMAMRRCPGRHLIHSHRKLNRKAFDQAMLDSMISVSPWGFGELCIRDVEAMFAGCVLVKPMTSFVRTWPEIFVDWVTYVPCRHDFKDLRDRVVEIVDRWDEFHSMRVRNRAMMLEYLDDRRIASRVASLLRI